VGQRLTRQPGLGGVGAALDAEVPVNRADYGLTFNQLAVMATHNTITIHAVFTRQ
jgi:hypothetical protein